MEECRLASTGKELVLEYFDRMSKRDLDGLLALFAQDATLYEPFSSENGLHGLSEIESFLRVAMMASDGLHREMTFAAQKKGDETVANVTFSRGGAIRSRFTFRTAIEEGARKIKSLKIEFLR
jgi:ketosteroid isomerase-like protein